MNDLEGQINGDSPRINSERSDIAKSSQFEEVLLFSDMDDNKTENSRKLDGSSSTSTRKLKKVSVCHILLITISMAGVVFCWAVQIGYATPFERQLGLGREFVSWVWMAGPISGIVVQTIVGAISDNLFIPGVGRRRPWMLLGVLSTSISLICFSNADLIGHYVFQSQEIFPIIVGTISFFCLDFSINFVQVSIRSLLVDEVPSHQQTLANICNTLCTGIGNSVGFGVGSIPFVKAIPFFGNQVRPTFFIGMNVLLFCVLITVTNIHETESNDDYLPVDGEEGGNDNDDNSEGEGNPEENERSFDRYFSTSSSSESSSPSTGDDHELLLDGIGEERVMSEMEVSLKCREHCCKIRGIPLSFWTAYVVQFLTYIGKFMLYLYMSDYVGLQIFNGDPNAPKDSVSYEDYANGVRYASFGFLLLSIVNVIYAPILNILTDIIPIKILWMFAQFIQFLALGACPFIHSKVAVLFVFAALGIVETNLNSVPWAIVNACIRKSDMSENKGLFQALFNTSQCLPQLLTAAFGALFVYLFEKWKWPPGSILGIGGLFGLLAFCFIPCTIIPEEVSLKRRKCYAKCCPCCYDFKKDEKNNKEEEKSKEEARNKSEEIKRRGYSGYITVEDGL